MKIENVVVRKEETMIKRGGFIMKKKILSMLLAIVTVISMLSVGGISASAVTMVGTNEYVTVRNSWTKSYLNVYGNRSANNTNVIVWAWDGTSGEDWKFVPCGKGYLIVPRCAPNRALNIYGNTAKSGSNVCTWSITKDNTQIWIPEYVTADGRSGYILRSAYNRNLVLSATGAKNGSNICVQNYAAKKQQIWTSPALSELTAVKKPSTASCSKAVPS